MSRHTTRLTASPTRTVAGSYEAPVEGIVDYGAFGRGFEKGLGDLSKIKQKEDVDLGGLEQKLFKTGSTNKLLGEGEEVNKDILGDKLLDDYARENSSLFGKGDTEAQKMYLQNLAKVQVSRNNRQKYWNRVGDSELNDTNFNHNLIDENGKEIPGLTPAVINRIHGDPSFAKNRRIGTKDIIFNGEVIGNVAGEYMTISMPDPTGEGSLLKMKEKEIFINYQDMNDDWQNKTFELNYNHESSLSKNKPKGFENKVVPGQMLEKKYDQETVVSGKTIAAGSTRNIISDDWYNDTEYKMNLAANEVFNFDQGIMGDGYESAFRQFMEQDFQLSPETIQKFKDQGLDITNANQIDKNLGANIKDLEKVNMLRDWWTQSSLIATASIGYDKGENGRAIANPIKIDRRYKESPVVKSGKGGLDIDIGGGNFTDRDLLKRVEQLLDRTGGRQLTPESVEAFAEGQVLRIPEAEKNIEVSKDMIRVDYGERGVGGIGPQDPNFPMDEQPIIRIDVPLQEGGTKTFAYDLSKKDDIEKLMKALYGTTSQTGTDWSLIYEPTIEYVQKQRAQGAQRQTLQQRKPLP